MNLAECLSHADIATLRGIAKTYELNCSMHSKLQLLQEISFTFRHKRFVEDQLEAWQQGNESVFLRIGLDTRHVFPAEELTGMFQSGGRVSERIDEAIRKGWLFPTTRAAGRLQYCVPEELHKAIRKRVIGTFYANVATSDDGPLIYRDEGEAMARDTDVFLQYVRNHDVQLTTEGSIYKRHLLRLLEMMEVEETPLEGGWRFGYGRRFYDYPDRFALLYDHAYAMRLISEGQDGFLHVTDGEEEWHERSLPSKQRSLLNYYISAYRRPIPRLPQMVRMLAAAPSQTWFSSDSMQKAWGDLLTEYYYDSRQSVWDLRILNMLRYLGIVRVGEDEKHQKWFQTTKLGQQLLTQDTLQSVSDEARDKKRILIVQPNFEIFVTADQPQISAELALFTELKQSGALRVYRLAKDTVMRGLSTGRGIEEWLNFLQVHGQAPVPGNVERTLLEWGRIFEAEQSAEDSVPG